MPATMQLVRRNWPAQEPGVMVVFCIVGVVAIALISLWVYRFFAAKKAEREAKRAVSHV